jgi:hypothetical protein
VDELRAHGATVVFPDLSDTDAVLDVILNDAPTSSTRDA